MVESAGKYNFIIKCDRLLLQSASGFTKCDRLYYKMRGNRGQININSIKNKFKILKSVLPVVMIIVWLSVNSDMNGP